MALVQRDWTDVVVGRDCGAMPTEHRPPSWQASQRKSDSTRVASKRASRFSSIRRPVSRRESYSTWIFGTWPRLSSSRREEIKLTVGRDM